MGRGEGEFQGARKRAPGSTLRQVAEEKVKHSMNRVAQVIGAIIGIFGVYVIWLILPVLPEFATDMGWALLGLIGLYFVVGGSLIWTAYGAMFRQSETDTRYLSLVSALMVMLFTDDLIEPWLVKRNVIEDPRNLDYLVSGLSIVLSIVAYQLLKRTSRKGG